MANSSFFPPAVMATTASDDTPFNGTFWMKVPSGFPGLSPMRLN